LSSVASVTASAVSAIAFFVDAMLRPGIAGENVSPAGGGRTGCAERVTEY